MLNVFTQPKLGELNIIQICNIHKLFSPKNNYKKQILKYFEVPNYLNSIYYLLLLFFFKLANKANVISNLKKN